MYPSLEAAGNPDAIIQVGPWVYPLNPATSAILKNELGVYVVPNPTSENSDMFVGIILPRTIDKKLQDEFESVLEQYATVRTSGVVGAMSNEQRQRTSERIASFLLQSGQRFAQGVKGAADKTQGYMNEHGTKYRSTMIPTDKPVNINPALRYGVLMVYKGSKSFAKVTKFVLDRVGEMGINIGKRMAGTVGGGTSGGSRLIGGAATILGGGITGASVVWISLEDASRQMFHSFADETVEMVKVRYGEPASLTTYHALHGAGHTTLSAFQLWDLGPRSIAGRVARKAGIQFVSGLGPVAASNAPGPSGSNAPALEAKKEPDPKKSKRGSK